MSDLNRERSWIRFYEGQDYDFVSQKIQGTFAFDQRTRMVEELVERWGMVAAMPDGEDSAGRQKLRLATPDELADRAFAVVDAVFARVQERGWYAEVPELIKKERS